MTRDLRKYIRQTNFRLVIGAFILLFVVGDGLIYLFYGSRAALLGLVCLLAGMTPVVMVALIILIMDLIGKHVNRE
jgi:energy-converting hydrogenase Eha subunit E